MAKKLRIYLADDHAVVREGIKRIIESVLDMEIVGEASDGEEVIAGVAALRPTTVVLDISMPKMGGAETTRRLKAQRPELSILALTMHEEPGYLRELLEAGASGYVVKRAAPDELIPALRAVSAGGTYIDPRMMTKLVATFVSVNGVARTADKLSEREAEVLRQVARGYTGKEIGQALRVSIKSIETHRRRGMEKIGLRNRADIVRYALAQGWLNEKE